MKILHSKEDMTNEVRNFLENRRIFHMDFSSLPVLMSVVGVALLCGTVISSIPSGGRIGEMIIISMFGFPIEAMPIITMVGTIVDPPVTMLNTSGDTVSGMLITL